MVATGTNSALLRLTAEEVVPMAELSWSEKSARADKPGRRRLSRGLGLLISAGTSLMLWGVIVEATRLF